MANTKIPSELVAINAISGTLIADNAITSVHIAENNITATQIAINAVTALQMADGTITSAKIADGTIVTADIADGQITTGKIADSSVTTGKIAAGTILSSDIANNAILTQHIDDNQITADQIADNAVGLGQLASMARGKIIVGDSAGNPSLLALGAANTLLQSDGTDLVFAPLQSGIDDNSNAVAITIDSSENVMIGKTSTSFTTAGIELATGGVAGKVQIQRASSPLTLVNLADDGGILNFYKGTTNIGSIGTTSGKLDIDGPANNAGLRFHTSSIIPKKNDTVTNNQVDLGYNDGSTVLQFKDLYLSGTAKVGGTNINGVLELISNNSGFPTSGMVLNQNNFVYLRGGSNGLIMGKAGDNEAMRIDSSGRVGIGTSSPSAPLHITHGTPSIKFTDSSSSANYSMTLDGVTVNNTNSGTNGSIAFHTHNGEKLRLGASNSYFSNSNVGIGETTPLGKLHVKEGDSGQGSVNSNFDQLVLEDDAHSGMTILSGTSSDGGIYFGDSGGNNLGQFKYKHGSNSFAFVTNNGTESLIIDSAGDVLIGQASQTGYAFAQKLVVGDGDNNDGITIQSGSTHQGNLAFNHSDGTTAHGRISYQHGTNYMQFFTNNTERMRIRSDGGMQYPTNNTFIATGTGSSVYEWGAFRRPASSDGGQLTVRQYSSGDTAANYPAYASSNGSGTFDENTGVYFPELDQVGLTANGNPTLTVEDGRKIELYENGFTSGDANRGQRVCLGGISHIANTNPGGTGSGTYLHIKTNLPHSNIMFRFEYKGISYDSQNMDTSIIGYTYAGVSYVHSPQIQDTGNTTYNFKTPYYSSDSKLVLVLQIANNYTGGILWAQFVGSHTMAPGTIAIASCIYSGNTSGAF